MVDSVRSVQDRLIAAMSPERKLLISQALRNEAWALKAAWIRERNPELGEPEVQAKVRQIFLDAGA
jgi:hypothetical protein